MSARKSTMFYGVLIALSSLVVGMVLASRLGLAPLSFAGPLTVPATNSSPLSGPIDATTFRTIAHQAMPAVVSIRTQVTRRAPAADEMFGFPIPPEFRNQIPGRRQQAPPQIVEGAGSGFIIDRNGFILTNNHVVADATRVEVLLSSMGNYDPPLEAKVIGTDVLTDTALIQLLELPEDPLPVVKFGDSAQLAPGDWVMAIGSPFRLSNTITVGVVSAVGRQQQTAVAQRFEEMIQTDAAINRGNSGGPLLNIRGEVVGINTQILSDMSGGNIGIGFAVPINGVRDIIPSLEKGKVVRGRIGVSVSMYPITREDAKDLGLPGPAGAEVTDVPDGPARAAGIRRGDVIIEFNGRPVKDNTELVAMVTRTTPGTTVPVKLVRARKVMTVNVRVDELDLAAEQEVATQGRPEPQEDRSRETGLGITIDALTAATARRLSLPQNQTGAVITSVEPGSPAAAAQLRTGDVIVEVNGQAVTNVNQASEAIDAIGAGRTARLTVVRGGREQLFIVRKR